MDDNQPLYDEFGTYIGPALDEDDEVDQAPPEQMGGDDLSDQRSPAAPNAAEANGAQSKEAEANRKAVILYEDRKIYPDASEVYPEAETLVMDEDIQPLSEPIIAPLKTKNFHLLEKKKDFPAVTYTKEYVNIPSYFSSLWITHKLLCLGFLFN
jgi:116 kDa U5 small nuclear ribonucleoprotein component